MTELLLQWMSKMAAGAGAAAAPRPDLLWMVALSDALVGLANFSIALALVWYVIKRPGRKVNWMIATFALFIFAIAATHVLAIWSVWRQDAELAALMKLAAAAVSGIAALCFWPVMSRAMKAPSQTLEQLHAAIQQLKHEVAERLRAEKALQQSQELLRQLAAYQEQIKEDERKRIAREIHDELGQSLMALRIDASMLQARTARSHPQLNEKVRAALAQIDITIKAVRAIINNLRPSVLDLGLHAAIDWQVNEFERRTGIVCVLEMEGAGGDADLDLDEARATALFRIVQESLSNVARHAQATQVRIRLAREDNRFVMEIADNGVGMFPGNRRKPNSFGLLGIEERISVLGGTFAVNSVPGEGTVLSMSIPIETDAAGRQDKPAGKPGSSRAAAGTAAAPAVLMHKQQGPHARPS